MAKINMEFPHKFPQDEALTRIKGLLGDVKKQHADKITNPVENWNGNTGTFSFTAMGFSVSGTLTVHKGKVELDGNLPFLATPLKGMIESTIRERAEKILA